MNQKENDSFIEFQLQSAIDRKTEIVIKEAFRRYSMDEITENKLHTIIETVYLMCNGLTSDPFISEIMDAYESEVNVTDRYCTIIESEVGGDLIIFTWKASDSHVRIIKINDANTKNIDFAIPATKTAHQTYKAIVAKGLSKLNWREL